VDVAQPAGGRSRICALDLPRHLLAARHDRARGFTRRELSGVLAPVARLRQLGVPVVLLWSWLVAADVRFRLHRPSRQERSGFDNAVVNWFGFTATLAVYFVLLPAGILALIWWLA
jgi:hypothetical protein